MFRRRRNKAVSPHDTDGASCLTAISELGSDGGRLTPKTSPPTPHTPQSPLSPAHLHQSTAIETLKDQIDGLAQEIEKLKWKIVTIDSNFKVHVQRTQIDTDRYQKYLAQILDSGATKIKQLEAKITSELMKIHAGHLEKIKILTDKFMTDYERAKFIESHIVSVLDGVRIDPADTTLVTLNFNGKTMEMFRGSLIKYPRLQLMLSPESEENTIYLDRCYDLFNRVRMVVEIGGYLHGDMLKDKVLIRELRYYQITVMKPRILGFYTTALGEIDRANFIDLMNPKNHKVIRVAIPDLGLIDMSDYLVLIPLSTVRDSSTIYDAYYYCPDSSKAGGVYKEVHCIKDQIRKTQTFVDDAGRNVPSTSVMIQTLIVDSFNLLISYVF